MNQCVVLIPVGLISSTWFMQCSRPALKKRKYKEIKIFETILRITSNEIKAVPIKIKLVIKDEYGIPWKQIKQYSTKKQKQTNRSQAKAKLEVNAKQQHNKAK